MRIAKAIIGAGWGDEGKGLATDALAAAWGKQGRDVTVVRSNGGAQAGHGVTMADGRHHVFHHVGAGSFSGAATHLSQFFVCHPMSFFNELQDLEDKGVTDLRITADPRALITTPWDMAINQALELQRSNGKHGSTGYGFGETIERATFGPSLVMEDLWMPGIEEKLRKIRDIWVPARMKALNVTAPENVLQEVLSGADWVLTRFSEDLENFAVRVRMESDARLQNADAVLFEGAQGLQLDMDLGAFPHVTRSHTGLPNMIRISEEAGIDRVDVTYMTRAYATRHGAGPFPHDHGTDPLEGTNVVDRTNVANIWQDAIRYAPLDLMEMRKIIWADLERASGSRVGIYAGLGVTCLDQIADEIRIISKKGSVTIPREEVAGLVARDIGLPLNMTSAGPVRENVSIQPRAAADLEQARFILNNVVPDVPPDPGDELL